MISELLNRRSLGSINSLADDSLSTFNDAFTIYGHPKVKDVLKGFEQLQAVQIPCYRTAVKLRCIQRKMEMHRVDVRDVITVFSNYGLPPSHEEIGESDMEPIISDICLMTVRNADTTTVISSTDLVLTWILQMFDCNYSGQVNVQRFCMALAVISAGRLGDKLKFLFDLCKGPDGLLDQGGFDTLISDLLMVPCSVFEEDMYGHHNVVLNASYQCFNQMSQHEREKVSLDEFMLWCTKSAHCLSWLFTLHRVMSSEYTVHLNPCSVCETVPFLGFRYTGLYSYNLNVCQYCTWSGQTGGESELREYGALGQCVNITVTPEQGNRNSTFISLEGPLHDYQQKLDPDYDKILCYSKRLDPTSPSPFISHLHDQLKADNEIEDHVVALIEECEDRAIKLHKDYMVLYNDHSEINKIERRKSLDHIETLQIWKKRDDMACRLAAWMCRRNDLFIKQETLLQDYKVTAPDLKQQKELGSSRSLSSVDNSANIRSPVFYSTKVPAEASVLVLSKLSLIINNVLLQKSLTESPPKPPRPLPTNGLDIESSKENIPSNILTAPQNENDVMQEFECVMNDIIIQEKMTPPTRHKTMILLDKDPYKRGISLGSRRSFSDLNLREVTPIPEENEVTHLSDDLTPPVDDTKVSEEDTASISQAPEQEVAPATSPTVSRDDDVIKSRDDDVIKSRDDDVIKSRDHDVIKVSREGSRDDDVTEEWVSDGSWETEDEITVNTEGSGPPTSLILNDEHDNEDVSEPECDPPEPDDRPPVPPPRNLLSPLGGSGRRATSLKTKEGDPKKEEIRKVVRASSTAHRNKSLTGIPTPTRSSSSSTPSHTPPIRSRIPTPKSYAQSPELSQRTELAKAQIPAKSKPTVPLRGPIVFEGDSDSETTSSSSSSSEEARKKFSRSKNSSKSARYTRSKLPPPSRNAASFKAKRDTRPPGEDYGFFNSFAE